MSDYRKGDIVWLEAEVVSEDYLSKTIEVTFDFNTGQFTLTGIKKSSVRKHILKPKPIEPKCRVRMVNNTSYDGYVVGIHEDKAWVVSEGLYNTFDVLNLIRVD